MYLYLIRCGSRGPIKIGVAKNVENRMADLQIGNPYKLDLLAKIQCGSKAKAYDLENRLHRVYARKRIRGEWFDGNINLAIANGFLNIDELDKAKVQEQIDCDLDMQLLAASPI